MAKLVKRIAKEDVGKEIVLEEEEDQEEVKEETKPIYSSGRTGNNPEEENVGRIQLKCLKCSDILSIERLLNVTLLCPNCGSKEFMSFSNFHMERPDKEKTVRVNDTINAGGIWKVA